jgi:hypothetical protein
MRVCESDATCAGPTLLFATLGRNGARCCRRHGGGACETGCNHKCEPAAAESDEVLGCPTRFELLDELCIIGCPQLVPGLAKFLYFRPEMSQPGHQQKESKSECHTRFDLRRLVFVPINHPDLTFPPTRPRCSLHDNLSLLFEFLDSSLGIGPRLPEHFELHPTPSKICLENPKEILGRLDVVLGLGKRKCNQRFFCLAPGWPGKGIAKHTFQDQRLVFGS